MVDKYVDAATGDDANAGTSGAPYATIQKAIDETGGGDTVFLANTQEFNLSGTRIAWDGHNGGEASGSPLAIKAWDNGGSLTCRLPFGRTRSVAAHILASTSGSAFSSSGHPSYVHYEGLRIRTSSGILHYGGTYGSTYQCEITDCNSTSQAAYWGTNYSAIIDSLIDDSSEDGMELRDHGAHALFCEVRDCEGVGVRAYNNNGYATVAGCLVHDIAEHGIHFHGGLGACCLNNTIVGRGVGGGSHAANFNGIEHGPGQINIVNNVVAHFNGLGAWTVGSSASNKHAIAVNNRFYNNTNDGVEQGFFEFGSMAAGVDPFTDAGNDDFSLKSTDAAHEGGLGYGSPSVGAWQQAAGSGGGASVFVMPSNCCIGASES